MITKYHFNLTRFYRNARELSVMNRKPTPEYPKISIKPSMNWKISMNQGRQRHMIQLFK